MENPALTSELVRAARALLRWEQRHLADASSVSLPTIKRLEAKAGLLQAHNSTLSAIRRAFEDAGIEFINGAGPGLRLKAKPTIAREKRSGVALIDENGGGAGVRLRKASPRRAK